jgi:hypothetical protein
VKPKLGQNPIKLFHSKLQKLAKKHFVAFVFLQIKSPELNICVFSTEWSTYLAAFQCSPQNGSIPVTNVKLEQKRLQV